MSATNLSDSSVGVILASSLHIKDNFSFLQLHQIRNSILASGTFCEKEQIALAILFLKSFCFGLGVNCLEK